ncbi:MAG: ELWxxDGT repeat protein, partial [Candidatus Limnocylindrus sp.]
MPVSRALAAALALLLVAAMPVRATTPPTITVVDSINPGSDDSYAMDLSDSIAVNGYLYFQGYNDTYSYELWRTNGTSTTLVKNISSDSASSPENFAPMGDYLYFSAYIFGQGYELWRTDGTEAGTTLVKDINAGSGGADGSYPAHYVQLGDYLYFSATQDTTGSELWRTDGTEAGTTLVKDIANGTDGSGPSNYFEFGDYVYFQANDGTSGYELWRTDGTEAGT